MLGVRQRKLDLAGLRERPVEELLFVRPDGSILSTKTATVWGWFQVRMRRFYLMKTASGQFFTQVESALDDEAELVPLNTRPEVVAVWNRCSTKLSAHRLFA